MKAIVLAGLLALSTLQAQANAAYVVDTGISNQSSANWTLSRHQYFGGQFALTQSYTIHSIESYFSGIRPGGITFSLHAAIPNSLKPGSIFFGDQILIQEYGSEYSSSWHGISNLNLQLDAGTYWLYLTPDLSFEGLMPAIAATPLDSYTQGGSGIWFEGGPDSFDYLNLAFRIDGTPLTNQSVPEPGTLFLICVALGGFAASRRKVQN